MVLNSDLPCEIQTIQCSGELKLALRPSVRATPTVHGAKTCWDMPAAMYSYVQDGCDTRRTRAGPGMRWRQTHICNMQHRKETGSGKEGDTASEATRGTVLLQNRQTAYRMHLWLKTLGRVATRNGCCRLIQRAHWHALKVRESTPLRRRHLPAFPTRCARHPARCRCPPRRKDKAAHPTRPLK